MVLVDGEGLPLGVYLEAANKAECQLAETTLAQVAVPRTGPGRPRQKPERIIADKGYDSSALRAAMRRRGIDLIVPHLKNRKHKIQDGRKLRRYTRRWIVERTNSWLLSRRRICTRWDQKIEHYRTFVHIACAMTVLNRF